MEQVMENLDYDMTNLDVKPFLHDDNYLIYSNGMIYSCKKEKFLTPGTNGKNSRYLCMLFPTKTTRSGIKKYYLHRLIAQHFLSNTDNLRDVHHIDNNPRNNNVNNLAWLSHKDNCKLRVCKKKSPLSRVEKNDMAYLCELKTDDYITFTYRGGYNNAPNIKKYFKTMEAAKKFRYDFFESYKEVA
tara:strand:- start:1424 stop:1981 length:558 start_codon:yes stop_codon:yes gene_type:complete